MGVWLRLLHGGLAQVLYIDTAPVPSHRLWCILTNDAIVVLYREESWVELDLTPEPTGKKNQ
jgi:hypothetical protein